MTFPRVAVILVNYRGRADTLECLASLRGLTYPNVLVYVVDQASGDGTPDAIRADFPEVRVIENPTNDGFAGGNNRGIEAALRDGAAYLYLLNNDTTVAPDLLEPLVSVMRADAGIGVAGSLMLFHGEPETVWASGGIMTPEGNSLLRDTEKPVGAIGAEPFAVDFVIGCGLMTRREVVETLGPLDEAYFLYYEETDFNARVARSGRRIVTVPASRLWHKVSRSTDQSSDLTLYYMRRNRLLYLSRYGDDPERRVRSAILDDLRLVASLLRRGKLKRARTLLRAVADFRAGRLGKAGFKL
jgi:GT2 family glycosyltransferase